MSEFYPAIHTRANGSSGALCRFFRFANVGRNWQSGWLSGTRGIRTAVADSAMCSPGCWQLSLQGCVGRDTWCKEIAFDRPRTSRMRLHSALLHNRHIVRAFQFIYEPQSGIQSVAVKKLRLSSKVVRGDRITVEADASSNSEAIYDLLSKVGQSVPLRLYNVIVLPAATASCAKSKAHSRLAAVYWRTRPCARDAAQ